MYAMVKKTTGGYGVYVANKPKRKTTKKKPIKKKKATKRKTVTRKKKTTKDPDWLQPII